MKNNLDFFPGKIVASLAHIFKWKIIFWQCMDSYFIPRLGARNGLMFSILVSYPQLLRFAVDLKWVCIVKMFAFRFQL